MSRTTNQTPSRRTDAAGRPHLSPGVPAGGGYVSEQDKLHLIATVADEIARKFRIADARDLWGIGWEACAIAEANWRQEGPLLGHMRACIRIQMFRTAQFPLGRRRKILSGGC